MSHTLKYYAATLRDSCINFLNFEHSNIKSKLPFEVLEIPGYRNVFFGYYDLSPFNPKDNNQLVLHANNENPVHNPRLSENDILIYNRETKEARVVAKSLAWNWQQGSRASWIDESRIIFNSFNTKKEKYVANTVNIDSLEMTEFPFPMQHFISNEFYLSLNYESLQLIRPDYGYRCTDASKKHIRENKIRSINIENGEYKTLVDINNFNKEFISSQLDVEIIKAKFNHIIINPSGTKFIFLYRYFQGNQRIHELFLFDIANKRTKSLVKNEIISHYCWTSDSTILFWGIINKTKGYYMLSIATGDIELINEKLGDGHPHLLNDNEVITDSYPDKSGLRKILRLNYKTGKSIELASTFHYPWFRGQFRCDPHPSLSSDKTMIQIDIVRKRRRGIALLDMKFNLE